MIFLSIYIYIATYRDVPRYDEIDMSGTYIPNQAENAEALIDWALSHIPARKFIK